MEERIKGTLALNTSLKRMTFGELDALEMVISKKVLGEVAGTPENALVYRVDIGAGKNGSPVCIFSWGGESVSAPVITCEETPKIKAKLLPIDSDLVYGSVDDLPEWMQRKLAVLSSIDCSKLTEELEGIGRRVSGHVFWVYPSAGERLDHWSHENGANARSKS
jgi:hypothetical protein